MKKDMFHERERAEEAVYFNQLDAKLIEKLRERARLSEIAHALADKLNVDNPELLRTIVDLGITLETGAAFIMAPLIRVAWVDGKVSPAERETILRTGLERGVMAGSPDHHQVLAWLDAAPSDAVFDASLEAIRIGLSVLPAPEAQERIERVMKACQEVAEASGGLPKLLHVHSGVSGKEHAILNTIRAAISNSGDKA